MPLEYFYTLPHSLEENRIVWRIQPQLWNHIHLLREQIAPLAELNAEKLEARIARFLFDNLQQQPTHELLRTHWMAFLQRRCEQVASKILLFFPVHLRATYFQDLFLMGCEFAIDSVGFFEKFDNRRSGIQYWYPTLKRFSDTKIKHLLIPKIRELTGKETLGITNLGLVARSSRTQIKEALQHSGYGQVKLSQYLLIWQCFQEVRTTINLAVNRWQLKHFQQVADRYQELGNELALSEFHLIDRNGEEIKAILENIAKAIRRLLDPPLDSLDTFLDARSTENLSIIEKLSFEPKIDEEIDLKLAELSKFIAKILEELEENEKRVLFLRHGLELKQGQIGKELGGQPQYQVSRNLQKLYDRILPLIWNWVKKHLEIEPSSEGLNEIEAVLCKYYSEQIDGFMHQAIQLLDKQSKELLKLCYIVKLNTSEIADKISKSETDVQDLLAAMRLWLLKNIIEQIQSEIQLCLQPKSAAEKKLAAITETKLETLLQLYLQ